jgi:hypothetical protein
MTGDPAGQHGESERCVQGPLHSNARTPFQQHRVTKFHNKYGCLARGAAGHLNMHPAAVQRAAAAAPPPAVVSAAHQQIQAQICTYGGFPSSDVLPVPPQALLDGSTVPVLYQGLSAAMIPPAGTLPQFLRNPMLATYPQMRWTQQLLSAAAAGDSAAVASALAAGTPVHANGGLGMVTACCRAMSC